jgi:hypothetical protein
MLLFVPQSRRACPLGVGEAPGRLPNPAPGGWPCALPATRRPPARGDGLQTPAARSGRATERDGCTREGSAGQLCGLVR